MESLANQIARRIERLKVLIVDDEPSMRKVARALLQSIGMIDVAEAPSPNGPELVRTVRSPGEFPLPDSDHHTHRPARRVCFDARMDESGTPEKRDHLDGRFGMSTQHSKKNTEIVIQSLCVLVVDDNQYRRWIIRNRLLDCGVKDIYEAADGIAALDSIRTVAPEIVVLDREMLLLSGPELVRIVRSPGVFPMPDMPIIILTGHCERWRVVEAVRLGVNEYLTKPVSAKALYDRLSSPSRCGRVRSYSWAIITARNRGSSRPKRTTMRLSPR